MAVSDVERASLIGVQFFSKEYFLKGKTEAISFLMLYSAMEVAFKTTALAIFDSVQDKHEPSRASKLIRQEIIDSIERDSSGGDSRYIKIVNEVLEQEKGFKPIKQEYFKSLKNMRNRIAHAACINFNKNLSEIDPRSRIDLDEFYNKTRDFIGSCIIFIRTHHNDIRKYQEDMEEYFFEKISMGKLSENN